MFTCMWLTQRWEGGRRSLRYHWRASGHPCSSHRLRSALLLQTLKSTPCLCKCDAGLIIHQASSQSDARVTPEEALSHQLTSIGNDWHIDTVATRQASPSGSLCVFMSGWPLNYNDILSHTLGILKKQWENHSIGDATSIYSRNL